MRRTGRCASFLAGFLISMRLFILTTSCLVLASAALADPAPDPQTVEAVTVKAKDAAGLLQQKVDATVFGLDKPLIETARSASYASAETLSRYGVKSIDDLVALAPGAFTDSYYGVAGALNLRGTLAETYFRGFKRIENRGTYTTPLGAADDIEIVRGPATENFGPSKVGGFLNFTPQTARVEGGFLRAPTGEIQLEGGAYGEKRGAVSLGLPVEVTGARGGVFFYGEGEADHSFYHGIYPSHTLAQVSTDLDLANGWSTAFGGMVFHETGDVQTPGWNRVTQNLISNGLYQAGRDSFVQLPPGATFLSHSAADQGAGPGAGLIDYYFGYPPAPDPRFALTTGVGQVALSPRTVFVSPADFSDTVTNTFYGDLAKDLGVGQSLKLQLFYDDLNNRRFVSYGYPADYVAYALETRLSYDLKRMFGAVRSETLAGLAYRTSESTQKESYNGGYLAPDRRDLSFGATADDILSSPFSDPSATWETDIVSRWTDAAAFGRTDWMWHSFDLTLGGRLDQFHDQSRDNGSVVYGATSGKSYAASKGAASYSASLTWTSPFGLTPYVTTARASSLELGQAGGIAPQLIEGQTWITTSTLAEAGLKLRAFDDALTGSLSVYRQTRTRLEQVSHVVGTRGEGTELELRWIASKNLSFTFAGDMQRTTVVGPDTSLVLVPPQLLGLTGVQAYGGAYAIFNVAQLRPGNYDDGLIPHAVASLYAVYTTDRFPFGRAGATMGVTHVSAVTSILPGAFILPAYATETLSGFVEHGPWRMSLTVDNLSDQRYFTPDADVLANVAVTPGIGRTWRLAAKRKF